MSKDFSAITKGRAALGGLLVLVGGGLFGWGLSRWISPPPPSASSTTPAQKAQIAAGEKPPATIWNKIWTILGALLFIIGLIILFTGGKNVVLAPSSKTQISVTTGAPPLRLNA